MAAHQNICSAFLIVGAAKICGWKSVIYSTVYSTANGISVTPTGNTATIEVTAISGVCSGLIVIYSLVPISQTDGMRVTLFNILREQSDLLSMVALIVVRIDVLTVVSFADLLDVFFQSFV